MSSHEYYMQTVAKERLDNRRQEAAAHRAAKLDNNHSSLATFIRDRLSALPGLPSHKDAARRTDGNWRAATS